MPDASLGKKHVMSDDTAFRLSRIRAAGWTAAGRYPADVDTLDEAALAVMNPYEDALEREGWAAGFVHAIKARRGRKPWHRKSVSP